MRLRSALPGFFPAALQAFDDLSAPDTLELLGRAPDPDRAARLSRARLARAQLAGALRRANRRNVETRAGQLRAVLRASALRQPAAVQKAYAAIVTGQILLIAAVNGEIDALGEAVAEHLAGTGTLRSTSVNPGSARCSAPGYWPSSATTRTRSPTRRAARTTPAAPPSPAHPAPAGS